jgi:cyclohexanecarboxylate-CoA ligase
MRDSALPRLAERYRDRYHEQGVWREETVGETFATGVEAHPDARLVGPERTVTYRDLAAEVRRVAAGLRAAGIDAGDVVSYQLPNRIEAVVVHAAVTRLGAVANPIVPIYRRSEVSYILDDAGSSCLVIPDEHRGFDYRAMAAEVAPETRLDRVVVVGDRPDDPGIPMTPYEELAATDPDPDSDLADGPDVDADDPHALLYTSGTTGDPKGVVHTHNTCLYELRATVDLLGLSGETTVFMPSPVTHVTGMLYALELPFLHGMDLVLQGEWDPAVAVDLVETHGCNVTVGATPFLRGLVEEVPPGWESPLRVFACGGADIPAELIREATAALGCTVQRVYGSTEFPTATWPPLDAPLEKLAETDGCPAPGVEVKVVDIDSRAELPPGERGELLARGPELMAGYLGEGRNEAAFDGEWFETGDLAVLDEDGYVEITGRLKDIIIRGGENIPVKDVEDRLYEHPAVADVAVVAMPDPELQEKGCAYVIPEPGHEPSLDELTGYLDEQGIATQKYPERLELVEEFPMTASGKIRKNVLRERIAEELGMEPVGR